MLQKLKRNQLIRIIHFIKNVFHLQKVELFVLIVIQQLQIIASRKAFTFNPEHDQDGIV